MVRRTPRLVAIAVGLVLGGGAVAAATGSPPDAADKGLSTAGGRSGIDVPASSDDHPSGTPADEAVEPDDDGGAGPVDNHGAEVSAVARDRSTTGAEHGAAVSEVARAGHGSDAAPVAAPSSGGTGTADDASDGASEVGTSRAADQAGAGSANAGDHGRP